jgi:threonine synthase
VLVVSYFIPANLEQTKVLISSVYGVNLVKMKGNYDQVNRLCVEIANRYNWAFVNINIRP